jgi:predicted transcriptional regulator
MQANLASCLLFGKAFLSGFKYRDRTSIIGDILDSINSDPKGKAKTSIMRDANLSLRQVDTYLKHLMVSGLIRATDPIESQEIARYRLTEKGFLMARDAARWRHLIGHRPRTI